MVTPTELQNSTVTPRLAQDTREKEAETNKAIGLFLVALVVLMVAIGGYYYANYDTKSAPASAQTDTMVDTTPAPTTAPAE